MFDQRPVLRLSANLALLQWFSKRDTSNRSWPVWFCAGVRRDAHDPKGRAKATVLTGRNHCRSGNLGITVRQEPRLS